MFELSEQIDCEFDDITSLSRGPLTGDTKGGLAHCDDCSVSGESTSYVLMV